MLRQKKITVNGIPCFEIMPEDETVKADLLLYHGWGSHATKQCFRGKLFAGFGYRVLVPELALHGERGVCCYDSVESAVDFLKVLLQSIYESNELISKGISMKRPCFIIGHSLGGLIALGTAMQNAAFVDGFVAMNSTALWRDYEKMLKDVFNTSSLDVVKNEEFYSLVEKLSCFNPEHWKMINMNKPVLLTNGALDQTVLADFNMQFCNEFSLSNVVHHVFPDTGHVVTDGMIFEVLTFIEDILNLENKRF